MGGAALEGEHKKFCKGSVLRGLGIDSLWDSVLLKCLKQGSLLET